MRITSKAIAETIFHFYRTTEGDEERRLAVRAVAGFIVRKNLEHLLPKILEELDRLEKKTAGIVAAKAVTAFPMSAAEHGKIKKIIAGELKIETEKLEMTFSEDKGILGGFIIKTEDALLDRSVNVQLDRLKEKLQV